MNMQPGKMFFWAFIILLINSSNVFSIGTPFTTDSHVIEKNGNPIFLVGDTVWLAGTQYDDLLMEKYLNNCQTQKFNFVGVFGTPLNFGLDDRLRNAYGNHPFNNSDPTQLNDAYWERFRSFVKKARKRGITVFMCVGGPLENRSPWPPLSDTDPYRSYDYGYALGKKFRDLNDAIIWSIAQDSRAGDPLNTHNAGISLSKLRNCAEGITDGVNNDYSPNGSADYGTTFMTFHCQGGQTTADYYHNEAWLDFNSFQTQWANTIEGSANRKDKSYGVGVALINTSLAAIPAKPIVNLEACYEGHTHSHHGKFDPDGNEYIGELKEAWHIRLEAYWNTFSGECGHVVGSDGLWNGEDYSTGINRPGRNDMIHLVRLIDAHPLKNHEPIQAMVKDARSPDTDKDYICAIRDKNMAWAYVYDTDGRQFTLNMDQIKGPTCKAYWYNPRNGQWHYRGGDHPPKHPFEEYIPCGSGQPDKRFSPPGSKTGLAMTGFLYWRWMVATHDHIHSLSFKFQVGLQTSVLIAYVNDLPPRQEFFACFGTEDFCSHHSDISC